MRGDNNCSELQFTTYQKIEERQHQAIIRYFRVFEDILFLYVVDGTFSDNLVFRSGECSVLWQQQPDGQFIYGRQWWLLLS